ncbi:hypothetical protein V3W47_04720 [Deinococcus sp. YIM 134068]|uniref:hypothetical protein n=1 Tax=Deinococcus lichenicola TaxID=3118910 RepID=UPI002F95646E
MNRLLVPLLTVLSLSLSSCLPAGRGADETWVTHRRDGTLLVNGRPFFPFGFYHLAWAEDGTAQGRLDDLREIGRGGFNVVWTEPLSGAQEFGPLLEAARRSGVYVVAHELAPAAAREVAAHPALLGFTLMDDSNRQSTPRAIRQLQREYKRLAPRKLTYISLSVGVDRPERAFFGVSDAVGNQSYPVGDPVDRIGVVYPAMRQTVLSAARRGVVPIANLQTFAWERRDLPSEAEVRNMTYQALMAGVKGVVYYAYRTEGHDIGEDPAAWRAAQVLAGEVRTLAPTLLDGKRTELLSGRGDEALAVLVERLRGPWYLFVLNNRETSREVRVRVPGVSRLTPVFGGATLEMERGVVEGTLPSLAAQVYEVR